MGLQIYANLDSINLTSGRVQLANDLRPKQFKQFVAGDSVVVDLFLTGQNGLLDIQGYPTVRLGIGGINQKPTSGSWDYGSETLQWDADAAAIQAAIAAETAANTTTELATGVFKVAFTANGTQTIETVDAGSLTPSSTVSIARLVTGDGSTPEVWLVRLFQNPVALIDGGWTNISGSGIRGTLNLGTEGVYGLLDAANSAQSTIELELTDSNGDITTVFQTGVTITSEVIGQGVTGQADFENYATQSFVTGKFATANTVWVSKSGNDSTGAVDRFDLPFLTVNAAEDAASSGDTIIVLPGDYSAESSLSGKDDVTYQGLDGAILPAFNVTTAITIKGSGLCQSLTCSNPGAVIDMPDMDTVGDAAVIAGKTFFGNVGGQAEVFDEEATGIPCVLECENAAFYFIGTLGVLTIRNANQSHDGTTNEPISLSSSGSLTIENSRHESTEENGAVIDLANNWSGSLKIFNSRLKATDGATTGIKYGTSVTGTVQLDGVTIETGEDVIIVTGAGSGIINGTYTPDGEVNGRESYRQIINTAALISWTGTKWLISEGTDDYYESTDDVATPDLVTTWTVVGFGSSPVPTVTAGITKSIDAPSAQTVLIGSPLKVTHDVDADVTLTGGSSIINTNFKA